MQLRFWFSAISILALSLIGLGSSSLQAGSWFGPSCYGADYAYQYPNRAHNYFGCGPGTHCTARHPFFERHRLRKNQGQTAEGAPLHAAPFEYAPVAAAPAAIQPASVLTTPVFSRIEPLAQPLPSAKPPF